MLATCVWTAGGIGVSWVTAVWMATAVASGTVGTGGATTVAGRIPPGSGVAVGVGGVTVTDGVSVGDYSKTARSMRATYGRAASRFRSTRQPGWCVLPTTSHCPGPQPIRPGDPGCGPGQWLVVGSTHQPGWRVVLERLAALPYVARIDRAVFE